MLVAVRVVDPAVLLVGIHFDIVQCHAAVCCDREIVVFLPRDGTLIISRFRHLNQLFSVTDLEGDLRCTVLRCRPELYIDLVPFSKTPMDILAEHTVF